jgi:CDP-glycerol glycerophosphotransferase
MPRISVVVPIYNVERYLDECLESIAAQTFSDLEVVMVNDGSTDGSAAIAEAFAARDGRFRLVSRPNGGLSRARNTGIEAAGGEFLAFVDSDDALPPNAYELLHDALAKTGSDFATGNFHRLTPFGIKRFTFASRAFRQTRLKTHVTEFWQLLADRTAWNKLWRRSFWDENGFRFPEGVVHEDIPVTLPAHFKARSVDVIAEPVYYYRTRDTGELSITQRRLEHRVLLDRLAAVTEVSDFLARDGSQEAKRRYDESVVADDLRYYLNVLESADEEYRELFLDGANEFLDRADPNLLDGLPAIERLKWYLVRRRLMPQVLEVVRFQREDLRETPPVRVRGRWYGDYPFRTDRTLRIPHSVYLLEQELRPEVGVEELRLEDGRLTVAGYAYLDPLGAGRRGMQRVTVSALRPGRLRRLRARLTPLRSRASAVRRPDVAANVKSAVADATWSGFEATLDLRRLLRGRPRRHGTWELTVTVRIGRIARRVRSFDLSGVFPVRAVDRVTADGTLVRVGPAPGRSVAIGVHRQWAALRGDAVSAGALELRGEITVAGRPDLQLELAERDGSAIRRYPAELGGPEPRRTFTARLPLDDLLAAQAATPPGDDPEGAERPLEVHLVAGGQRVAISVPEEYGPGARDLDGREVAVFRNRLGNVGVAVRMPRAVLTKAGWTRDGALELEGTARVGPPPRAILLSARAQSELHEFRTETAPGRDGFRARLTPAHTASLGGPLALAQGKWDVMSCPDGGSPDGDAVPLMVAPELYPQLPEGTVVDGKPLTLTITPRGRAELVVAPDLDQDEVGRFNELRLRRSVYIAGRDATLRDAVLYSSFDGLQYSDGPRAIHEELVRRKAPLEHLWVVRDGRCRIPPTATTVREGSREHYDALARARYLVFNDHFPDWFSRRPDQTCLQMWHGTPLRPLGSDAAEAQGPIRQREREWSKRGASWQYVASPNRFSTPILRRAYAVEGEMLEAGYPRTDVLAGADGLERGRALRERLHIPQDARVVLYAPTYRHNVVDGAGRYRFELRIDLARLRDALGPDTIVLVRKHPYVIDAVPVTGDPGVRDVSSYPDSTELMLAADVLVTDYSSMMFDFANTGRPILLFAYDLDAYQADLGGLYLDLAESAPGPLLRTFDDVVDALRDVEAIRAGYEQRYAGFVSTFCELDDGNASARVVERVFDR